MKIDYHPSSADAVVRAYREAGLPRFDQALAYATLTSDELTDEQKRFTFLTLGVAKDFTSDDPAVWSQARQALAALTVLDRDEDAGLIDRATFLARGEGLLRGLSDDVVLAAFHLLRARAVADEHAARQHGARNDA